MSAWFTSDTHFGHKNIIEYSARPFRTLDGQLDVLAMNEALIRNWNERVRPGDTVYHLGDFAMGKAEDLPGYVARLNGRKELVLGNHDRNPRVMLKAGFDVIHKSLTLKLDGLTLFMRHHPVGPQEVMPYCDLFLHGHVHQEWARRGKLVNVGVDVSGYRPLSLAELLARDPA